MSTNYYVAESTSNLFYCLLSLCIILNLPVTPNFSDLFWATFKQKAQNYIHLLLLNQLPHKLRDCNSNRKSNVVTMTRVVKDFYWCIFGQYEIQDCSHTTETYCGWESVAYSIEWILTSFCYPIYKLHFFSLGILQHLVSIFGSTGFRTWDGWARSAMATCVLYCTQLNMVSHFKHNITTTDQSNLNRTRDLQHQGFLVSSGN